MMGHIFSLLVGLVRKLGGEETVRAVLEDAGASDRQYRFEVVYPEDEFARVLAAAVKRLGVGLAQAEIAFGDHFMEESPKIFASIFDACGGARTFLERLPHVHRSFPSAAYAGVYRDKLTVASTGPDWIEMRYDSPHRLCGLMVHLSHLLLRHYGERGAVDEVACARRGADACLVRVTFKGRADRPPQE